MKQQQVILPLLPEIYASQLRHCDWDSVEEIRIGSGRPLRIRYSDKEREILPPAGQRDVEEILQRAAGHSLYAYTDTIRHGYLTVAGGHRIGICGFGVTERGEVKTLRELSSLNIRIAHSVSGCADGLLLALDSSLLIIGPPGAGKTTLLRDAVRSLSDRCRKNVGLVDERGEISASAEGVPGLYVGQRTDVLINVPKAAAVMMLLKTMSPDWIALDEITAAEDLAVMEQASYCGVKLLATAHAASVEELQCRPLYRKLMEMAVFEKAAVLKKDKSYTIQEV